MTDRRGRETEFFVKSEWDLLPLLQRNDGGEGWGEESVIIGKPLSLSLPPSPFLTGRGNPRPVKVYGLKYIFRAKSQRKDPPEEFCLTPDRRWT